MNEIKVGNRIYYIRSKHGTSLTWGELFESEIIKVTSQSLIIKAYPFMNINKKTLKGIPTANYKVLVFLNKIDYENQMEYREVFSDIKAFFNKKEIFTNDNERTIDFQKLLKIAEILEL
jgi:GTPase Era involved in 16S rRNA processing